MLSEETRSIIKATVPVLEQNGTTITTTFYKNMLREHKELLNIFNQVNQSKGVQPAALATTVLAAAKHIDDMSVLLPHVEQIGHKHRALQIKPEHYPIVGQNLLKAIAEVLGDAATPKVLNAWAAAYDAIADIFIRVEKKMYDEAAWQGWKPFDVVSRKNVASDIVEFTVAPSSGSGIDLANLQLVAGQYITVKTHPTRQNNQYDALRHYSLCSIRTEDGLRFAVKLEESKDKPVGLVSEYLHKDISIGDILYLSAPAGDFAANRNLIFQNSIPLVLLASGVGVTPVLAMLECQIKNNPKRPVIWIQSSRDESKLAFKTQVDDLLQKCSESKKIVVFTTYQPRIDTEFLRENVPGHADLYICGSLGFMQSMIKHFEDLQHQDDTIHYEPFGPKMATINV